jgi:hypothetical protein
MRRFTNLGFVLKKKARIYVWLLLVGCIPAWAYGLIEGFEQFDSDAPPPAKSILTVLFVASLWIVVWRWEAIEQRKLPKRVRILLLGISYAVGFAVFETFLQWCMGRGHEMYLPIILSSAPLSVLPVSQRLGLASASALGPVLPTLKALTMLAIPFGTPVLWGTMAVLAASPRTRRRRRLFVGTILSHYLVGVMAIVLMTGEDWDCLSDVGHAVPGVLAGWALVYAGAHVLLWRSFLKNRTTKGFVAAVAIPAASAPSVRELSEETSDVHDDTLSPTRS